MRAIKINLVKNNQLNFLFLILVLVISLYNYFSTSTQTTPPTPDIQVVTETPKSATSSAVLGQSQVKVKRVIDGDTIELEDGQVVRYIGIDTPETKHPAKPVECFGQLAADQNRQLVEGKLVNLEKDISQTDRYGRLLRYVYSDSVMINELLVKEGFATVSSYPPDIKYQEIFIQAERDAQLAKKGLWGEVCSPK